MNLISVNANAKINFSIDVLGRREDGYHLVDMIMQTIPLYDKIIIYKPEAVATLRDDVLSEILTARRRQDERIEFFRSKGVELQEPDPQEKIMITCTNPKLPVDKKNLAYKAALIMLKESGYTGKIGIHIKKKIPVGGGMGGGSADGAGVLLGLNELLDLNYPKEKLCEFAATLGSDVPFLVQGGTALATDTGTTLKPLPSMRKGHLLVVNPNIFVSTEKVYSKFDSMRISTEAHPDTALLIQCLEKGDLETFAANIKNVLEYPAFELEPQIKTLKKQISETGAVGTLMSGSGSTVFGIYDSKDLCLRAMNHFRANKNFAVALDLSEEI